MRAIFPARSRPAKGSRPLPNSRKASGAAREPACSMQFPANNAKLATAHARRGWVFAALARLSAARQQPFLRSWPGGAAAALDLRGWASTLSSLAGVTAMAWHVVPGTWFQITSSCWACSLFWHSTSSCFLWPHRLRFLCQPDCLWRVLGFLDMAMNAEASAMSDLRRRVSPRFTAARFPIAVATFAIASSFLHNSES